MTPMVRICQRFHRRHIQGFYMPPSLYIAFIHGSQRISFTTLQICQLFDVIQEMQHNMFNPLNAELNPICYLLALLGVHHFLHVSRIRVKLLTFRLLMSYIYMEHPFLMFLDHTQRRSTVGRTPLDQ